MANTTSASPGPIRAPANGTTGLSGGQPRANPSGPRRWETATAARWPAGCPAIGMSDADTSVTWPPVLST